MSDNLLALVLERDKEIAALKAENDRLRETLTSANETIVKLSQAFSADSDRLHEALASIVHVEWPNDARSIARAALMKEAGQ